MESLKRLVEELKNHKAWVTNLTLGTVISCGVFGVLDTAVIASKVTQPVDGENVYMSENLDIIFKTTTALSTTETIQGSTVVTTKCTTQSITEIISVSTTTTAIVTSTFSETTTTELKTDIVAMHSSLVSVEEKNISGSNTNHLTKHKGVSKAPNGFDETYYDLDMSGVVMLMRNLGFSEEEYPYWIDSERGTKMLGPYIMVAADLNQVYCYERGDIVETDLGTGIVCDTGGFVYSDSSKYDIATNWDHERYPGYNC